MDCAGTWRGEGIDPHYIGIFGGSFDPPHVGHVDLVKAAFAVLDLPEIWVVPAGNPVHRNLSGCASPEVRLHWLERIFSADRFPDTRKVKVLAWEVQRQQPTPTIDTLRHIREKFPDCHPLLLLGTDAFSGMRDWVEYPAHLSLCDVAVFNRTGCAGAQQQGWTMASIERWRHEAGSGRFLCVRNALPDVSATAVRKQAAAGKSLAGLVPECVCAEIERAYSRKHNKECM